MPQIHKIIITFATLVGFLIACKAPSSIVSSKATVESTAVKSTESDLVYPLLDAANSRWFYFASACRPFGMVNLSPDTQVGGAWGSGYKYDTDTIKGLSHIHAWQMSGVSVMPVAYDTSPEVLLDNYYSKFSHDKETVEVGYHSLTLERYGIDVALTSTTRVGFHDYKFNKKKQAGVVFKLSGDLGPTKIKDGSIEKVDAYTIQGQMTNSPTIRRPKDLIVYFYVKFDKEIKNIIRGNSENAMVTFNDKLTEAKMKVGISYTSVANAKLNLETELNHWNFDQVVADSKTEWNKLLSRIQVSAEDTQQQRRFYTDLWHGLQGRRIISDVSGNYPDNTQDKFRVGTVPMDANNKPAFNHYNSDSFWGAQWTINVLWGLVYPEIYREFVHSLLQYYKDGGLIPRGPSGGNYTYVMTGSSSTPFLVSAYQKGIKDYDVESMYEGLKKNHMHDGIMSKAGYEHKTNIGGGLDYYIENGYVPHPIPEGKFGFHQDGASLTMEYAYQDWTLAQLALALGKKDDYALFMKRSKNYVNVYDDSSTWMRPKSIEGDWKEPFDPFQYENGFNESNAAQSTWFVGHDIKGLGAIMGGNEKAVEKLNQQFEESMPRNFTSGNSHQRGEDPSRARIAINYGNQPSMQTAYIFNQLGRPDLTQYWSRKVIEAAFSGLSPYTGYNGDEDQGLMGSLAVILKLGMFQLNGGTEANPAYEFGYPVFRQVTINLQSGNTLELVKEGDGTYIESLTFNGTAIPSLSIGHDELMAGGKITFKMK